MVTSNDKPIDSITDIVGGVAVPAPAPKKRGRPSNAELAARRAAMAGGEDVDPELDAEEKNGNGNGNGNGRATPGITGLGAVTNDAEPVIGEPFTIHVRIEGTADLLFHRYSADEVEEKANAAKGSRAKKTDNVESYVYRNADNLICMPGRYLQRALQEAGRFQQDPRSPRKSALDLCKAGLIVTPQLAPMIPVGRDEPSQDWDYLDRQRVVVQRSAVTRVRPAFTEGWRVELEITSLLPEYLTPQFVRKLADDAGRFIGLADFRPTYGRYAIVFWEVRKAR
jgi:hypothetical protein